ncbi:ribonuclease H-like domain-containing protein [Tanacetum coccineum]
MGQLMVAYKNKGSSCGERDVLISRKYATLDILEASSYEQIIDSLHQEFSMTDLDSLNYILGIFVVRDSLGMFLSHRKYATDILELAHMQIIDSLHQEFSMTDLDSLNYILGNFVVRDSSGMFLSQRKYATDILERAHMVSCNPSRTPDDTESKLGADGDPVYDLMLYRSLAGALRYLTFTSPDISYAVQQHQPTLSRSSAEAKYHGVANAVSETCWLRNLLRKLHTPLSSAIIVYYDNVRVLHVPSRYQYADIFTKGLPSALLRSIVLA